MRYHTLCVFLTACGGAPFTAALPTDPPEASAPLGVSLDAATSPEASSPLGEASAPLGVDAGATNGPFDSGQPADAGASLDAKAGPPEASDPPDVASLDAGSADDGPAFDAPWHGCNFGSPSPNCCAAVMPLTRCYLPLPAGQGDVYTCPAMDPSLLPQWGRVPCQWAPTGVAADGGPQFQACCP